MADPNVDPTLEARYGALTSPQKAMAKFQVELITAYVDLTFFQALEKLLVELGPFFWEGEVRPKYEVWLIHAHYKLNANEKVVSQRNGDEDIMEPMLNPPPGVIPERWDNRGLELEHRLNPDDDANKSVEQPSEALLNGFQCVMRRQGITALGVGSAPTLDGFDPTPDQLAGGYRLLERSGIGMRRHITTLVNPSELVGSTETAWLPIKGSAVINLPCDANNLCALCQNVIHQNSLTTMTGMTLSAPIPNPDDPMTNQMTRQNVFTSTLGVSTSQVVSTPLVSNTSKDCTHGCFMRHKTTQDMD